MIAVGAGMAPNEQGINQDETEVHMTADSGPHWGLRSRPELSHSLMHILIFLQAAVSPWEILCFICSVACFLKTHLKCPDRPKQCKSEKWVA